MLALASRSFAMEKCSTHCGYLGQANNNTAEYRALIKGLERASGLKADRVSVRLANEGIKEGLETSGPDGRA